MTSWTGVGPPQIVYVTLITINSVVIGMVEKKRKNNARTHVPV